MGYTQSSRTLAHLMTEWRRQDPDRMRALPRRRRGEAWTARRVAFLFIAPLDRLTSEQATYLAAVRAEPALSDVYALAQDFVAMLRSRQGQRLDDWIAQAVAADSAELGGFATGLLADKAAVQAGLTLTWSTGPCEGHIHKIKLIKRSMYGKAGFRLLRRRVLATQGASQGDGAVGIERTYAGERRVA